VSRIDSLLTFALLVALAGAPGAAGAQPTRAAAPQATRASGHVQLPDGARIRYVEAGTGPVLLFVPGWTMHAEIWDRQIEHFSPRWRVVAIDPRSQGDSSKESEGLFPAQRARDLQAVIETLKLSPVVLVAWSMGVSEAAAYVAQFGTAHLAAVVLVDGIAGGPFDPKTTPFVLQAAARLQQDRANATEAFVRSMFRTPQPEPYLASVVRASLKTPSAAAVALVVGAMAADNRDALNRLDKPALIAIAPGGPFDAAYADMHQRIPGSRLERFEGAGHALFVDQAERFNTVLDAFLEPIATRR
jgi:microsomal epoxide hydrolase